MTNLVYSAQYTLVSNWLLDAKLATVHRMQLVLHLVATSEHRQSGSDLAWQLSVITTLVMVTKLPLWVGYVDDPSPISQKMASAPLTYYWQESTDSKSSNYQTPCQLSGIAKQAHAGERFSNWMKDAMHEASKVQC